MIIKFNLYENVDQAKSYLNKNNIPESDWVYKLIRELLKGKEGYVGWLTKIAYEYIVPNNVNNKEQITTELHNIATKLSTEKYLLDLLPKPVIQYENYEEFLDDYEKQIKNYKAKKMYDEFPSTQKKLLNLKKIIDINFLAKLHDDRSNNIFLKKISAYKDRKTLIDSIKRFIYKLEDNNFNKKLQTLSENELPIIHADENNNLIIARILNYKQCSIIGSRTSWCIARGQSTFNSYVPPNSLTNQYVIYLTDLDDSDNNNIIGATFNIEGYRTAHNQSDSVVSRDKLKEILEKRNFDIKKLYIQKETLTQADIDKTSVKDLKKGVNFTIEEILKVKKVYNPYDLTYFTKEEIETYDLLKTTKLHGEILEKYTKKEIIDKKLLDKVEPYTLKINTLLNLKFNRKEIEAIPGFLVLLTHDDKTFYEKYLSKSREVVISKNCYDLRYGSKWGGNEVERYDPMKTIDILRWYEITPNDYSMKDLTHAIDEVSYYDYPKVKNFLDERGYSYTDEEIINFLLEITGGSGQTVYINKTLIEMGYDRYDVIIKYIMNKTSPTRDYEMNEIKEVLTKGNKLKELDKFIKLDELNQFVQSTKSTAKYRNYTDGKLTINEWWTKWGNYGAMLDWNDVESGYDSEIGTLISYIILVALTNNYDYLYSIRFNWERSKMRGWSVGTYLEQLSKVICGTSYYNHDPKYKEELRLTIEMREKLYQWIMKHIWSTLTDKTFFRYDLQVLHYLFDKDRFYKYVDEVKNMRNNYETTDSKGNLIKVTRRVSEIMPVIKFLEYAPNNIFKKDINSIEELRKILTYFMNGINMNKSERILSAYNIADQSTYTSEQERTKAINKMVEDVFDVRVQLQAYSRPFDIIDMKGNIKESIIIDYNKFKTHN